MNIATIVKKKLVEGDVGIEIEVEGANLPGNIAQYWTATHDGSLRGESMEYVFKKPLAVAKVPEAMDVLNGAFKAHGSKLDFSYRCSVHVHVNVGQLDVDALIAFMYAYLLLERPLMKYCGEERIGNRFALRFEDAEALEDAIHAIIAHKARAFQFIKQDQYRYSSMNIDALKKFGSLEFRGMKGTNDKDVVSNWAKALVNLRDFSEKLGNPKEVYDYFCHFGPEKFLQDALGDVAPFFEFANAENDMRHSFSITLDFPFAWINAQDPAPEYDEEELEWLNQLDEEEEDA